MIITGNWSVQPLHRTPDSLIRFDTIISVIGELKLPGIHFFIDETLDAELSKYFSFSGYPGYAFIDRNGVYKPGAIERVSNIKDRAALAALVK